MQTGATDAAAIPAWSDLPQHSRAFEVLPRVIHESTVQPFKFLFNGTLQEGIHFHNELYYRLKKQPLETRSRLYQLACRLAKQGADVLVTADSRQCSLWANLRNQRVTALIVSGHLSLPTVDSLLSDLPVSALHEE